METFLVTLGVFTLALCGLGIGAILKYSVLQGSCGGLGKIMGKDCSICDKKDRCKSAKEPEIAS